MITFPRLYEPAETAFATNGLGALSDCVSCTVTEERNGAFELILEYPVNGVHYSDIHQRSLIFVKPNPTDNAQPFRVYRITKPLAGIVTIYAAHISYDLSGVPVDPFVAYNLSSAISQMANNSVATNPFTLITDKAVNADMIVRVPTSFRALMGGIEGSLLDVYGGEYHYDCFTISLENSRGSLTGVSLRYGKNITSLEQDENCSSCYTSVYPYWYSEDDGLVTGSLVPCSGTYDYVNILSLDCTDAFDTVPSEADLEAYAASYISANGIGIPNISLTVNYAQDSVLCETVSLCDTITVEFPLLGVSAYAKVVKTEYNALTGRFNYVELGNMRTSIAQTIADQSAQISENVTQLYVETRKLIHDWAVTNEEFNSAITDLANNTTSQIKQLDDKIEQSVSDMGNSLTSVQTSVSQLWDFRQTITENDGTVSSISKYIRFQNGSIVLGESNSDMKLRISNDAIIFFSGKDFDNDVTIYASFDPTELWDNVLKALSSIYVGDDTATNNFKISKTAPNGYGEFTIARV